MAKVVEIRGADLINKLLRELPKAVTQGKKGGVVADALRKGARVIYYHEKLLLERAIAEGGDESTGLLLSNLKVRRGKLKGNGERVTIGGGKRKYKLKGKTVKDKKGKEQQAYKNNANTALTAARLEYGTSTQRSVPFARPAFNAKADQAFEVINDDLLKTLDKLAQKYLPQET